jgi:hypothetical protein
VISLKESQAKLAKSVEDHQTKAPRCGDTASLSLQLQGIIDAGVNGGPRKYADTFLNDEFLRCFPKMTDTVQALKNELISLAQLISGGLVLHERICAEAMLGLHMHLEGLNIRECFSFSLSFCLLLLILFFFVIQPFLVVCLILFLLFLLFCREVQEGLDDWIDRTNQEIFTIRTHPLELP